MAGLSPAFPVWPHGSGDRPERLTPAGASSSPRDQGGCCHRRYHPYRSPAGDRLRINRTTLPGLLARLGMRPLRRTRVRRRVWLPDVHPSCGYGAPPVSPGCHGRTFRPRRPRVHAPGRGTEPSSSVCCTLRDLYPVVRAAGVEPAISDGQAARHRRSAVELHARWRPVGDPPPIQLSCHLAGSGGSGQEMMMPALSIALAYTFAEGPVRASAVVSSGMP
jgi:hypothetical protein